MNSYKESLKHKYKNSIIPKENLKQELDQLAHSGTINYNTQNLNEDITIDEFINYVEILKRNQAFNNFSVFKESQEMNDDLDETYANVSDFIEDEEIKCDKRMDIVKDVVGRYVDYEKMNVSRSNKGRGVELLLILVIVVIGLYFYAEESKPF
ncbi:hypothetical protein COBT_000074 [Conglomerata obtusa]